MALKTDSIQMTTKTESLLKTERILGYSSEQIKRAKALRRMGLTESDVEDSKQFFMDRDSLSKLQARFKMKYNSLKSLKVFGVSEEVLLQKKALDVLGLSIEEYETFRSKGLSNLGT